MATQLSPYILFKDNCREALNFYAEILGGEVEINTVGDSPMDVPEAMKDRVMHGTLKTGSFQIMACDEMGNETRVEGSNTVSLSLNPDSVEEGQRLYDALSAGGNVMMKYEKQFWGDTFGMVLDKFGIRWMINAS